MTNKAHVHAENMALYAQDALTTDEPWKLWQYELPGGWGDLVSNPGWNRSDNYRRKPKTIRIGDYDVPEPLRVAPENRTLVWSANISAYDFFWLSNDNWHITLLNCGFIHATKEDAEIHAKALRSFTEVK